MPNKTDMQWVVIAPAINPHGDSSAGSIFRAIPESAAAETLWAVEMHIEFMRRLWGDINPTVA